MCKQVDGRVVIGEYGNEPNLPNSFLEKNARSLDYAPRGTYVGTIMPQLYGLAVSRSVLL